jgi:hypothetical protein
MHDLSAGAAAVGHRETTSYHDSRPLCRLKSLAEAFHARVNHVRWAKVQDEDVVVMSLDHLFKATRQFCAAACGRAALKNAIARSRALA